MVKSMPKFGILVTTSVMMLCATQLHATVLGDKVCREKEIMGNLWKHKPKYKEKLDSKGWTAFTPRFLLQSLRNCTVYYGDIKVTQNSAADVGFEEYVRYEDLLNLKNLREIYGIVYLNLVQYPKVKSLSFFESLRKIQTSDKGFTLMRSQVEMIDFSNVQLNVAFIGIRQNKQLCYLENIRTINSTSQFFVVENKNPAMCSRLGRVCSTECKPTKGCWGPSGKNCFQCQNWKAGFDCVNNCEANRDFFTPRKSQDGLCGRCHIDCKFGCFGSNKNQCYHDTEQKDRCLKYMFFDNVTRHCKECSRNCFGDSYHNRSQLTVQACTGLGNLTGPEGCSHECQGATFLTISPNGLFECSPCHDGCLSCRNGTMSGCLQRSKSNSWVIWLVFILLIIAIGILVFFYRRHKTLWRKRLRRFLERLTGLIRIPLVMEIDLNSERSSALEMETLIPPLTGLRELEDITDQILQWSEANSKLLSVFNISVNFQELGNDVQQSILKEQKQMTNFVFVGTPSLGKSMVINALLQMNLMPYGIGCQDLSAIWIKTTQSESYFESHSGSGKRISLLTSDRGLTEFNNIMENGSDWTSQSIDYINVYVSERELGRDSLLSENASILVTSGIRKNMFDVYEVEKGIYQADAMILVIDIITLEDKEMVNLLKSEQFCVKPNTIFAVNISNALIKETNGSRDQIKERITEDICDLEKYSQISKEEIRESVHFIYSDTALKRTKMQDGDKRVKLGKREREMMKEFDHFKKTVVSIAHENRKKNANERIDEAVKTYINDLRFELKILQSDLNGIKQDVEKVLQEIMASRVTLNDAVNLSLIKEIYDADLRHMTERPGKDKILEFITCCRRERKLAAVREDLKQAMRVSSMDERIKDYFDTILKEVIDGLINEKKADEFIKLFSVDLNPRDLDASTYKKNISEIENEIKGLKTFYEKIYQLYVDECEEEINRTKSKYEAKQQKRLQEILDLENRAIPVGDSKSDVWRAKDKEEKEVTDSSLSGLAKGFSSKTSSLLKLGSGKKKSSRKIKELRKNNEAKTKKEEGKLESEKKRIEEKKMKRKASFRTEQDKKRLDLQMELEKKKHLALVDHQARVESYHSDYIDIFNELYVRIIECASDNVQQNLCDTVEDLEAMTAFCGKRITDLISSN